MQAGSAKQNLQKIDLKHVYKFGIWLDMEWIPPTLNDKANYISHIQDVDDWQINPLVFANVDTFWGPHSVDCFANVDTVNPIMLTIH